MDLYDWERDDVPSAGEVYVIKINDSDNTFIKIGDGYTEFCDLPAIPNFYLQRIVITVLTFIK